MSHFIDGNISKIRRAIKVWKFSTKFGKKKTSMNFAKKSIMEKSNLLLYHSLFKLLEMNRKITLFLEKEEWTGLYDRTNCHLFIFREAFWNWKCITINLQKTKSFIRWADTHQNLKDSELKATFYIHLNLFANLERNLFSLNL